MVNFRDFWLVKFEKGMGFHGEFCESVSDPKIGANQKEP